MIITAMSMYLNTVHGASYSWGWSILADIIICAFLSASTRIKLGK